MAPEPAAKAAGKLPKWAYVVAAGIGVVLVYFLMRGGKATKNTVAGADPMSGDVAAAGAGAPASNYAPGDLLNPDVLGALGFLVSALNTSGNAQAGVNTNAGPGGAGGGTGAVSGQVYKCVNNNRECPPGYHCHNATGTCTPHPNEEPGHRHCGQPGMPPCVPA